MLCVREGKACSRESVDIGSFQEGKLRYVKKCLRIHKYIVVSREGREGKTSAVPKLEGI